MYFVDAVDLEKYHAVGRKTVYQSGNVGQYFPLGLMRIYTIFFVTFRVCCRRH
jgi:hypothetical protein